MNEITGELTIRGQLGTKRNYLQSGSSFNKERRIDKVEKLVPEKSGKNFNKTDLVEIFEVDKKGLSIEPVPKKILRCHKEKGLS